MVGEAVNLAVVWRAANTAEIVVNPDLPSEPSN
jgi:hypothetical protein